MRKPRKRNSPAPRKRASPRNASPTRSGVKTGRLSSSAAAAGCGSRVFHQFGGTPMGLFDQIISGALRGAMGQGDQGDQSSLMGWLLGQMLGQTNLCGLGGLLKQIQQGGLEHEGSSGLGNAPNPTISPEQVRAAQGSRR